MAPFFGGVLVFTLISLAGLVFNIWMLVDAARRPENDFNPPSSRMWWVVGLAVGLLLPWIGLAAALVYFFMVRRPSREGRPAQQLFRASPGGAGAVRHCATCGEKLGTHSRYCQNCGTSVGEDR